MVEVIYFGGLGNRLFQYCFGRIIAEGLGFTLKADPIPEFPQTAKKVEGKDFSNKALQIISDDFPFLYDKDYDQSRKVKNQDSPIQYILNDKRERKILIQGYFQLYEYYQGYKEKIRNDWLLMGDEGQENTYNNNIVVCVRRGGYVQENNALPFSFYKEVLEKAQYDKVFITTDDPKDPFFKEFTKYNPVVMSKDTIEDFKFIKKSNKIVISQSTFHWWAAFLSLAQEIYYPLSRNGFWDGRYSTINLKVTDESRFIYTECKESYPFSLSERIKYVYIPKLKSFLRSIYLKLPFFLKIPLYQCFRLELKNDCPVAFSGYAQKETCFLSLVNEFNFLRVVETGTFRGATTEFMLQKTSVPIYSADADLEYYVYAKLRLFKFNKCQLFLRNAASFIELLNENKSFPKDNVFFYLNWCRDDEASLEKAVSLIGENFKHAIIMVDEIQAPRYSVYSCVDYYINNDSKTGYLAALIQKYSLNAFVLANFIDWNHGCVILSTPDIELKRFSNVDGLKNVH